MGRWGRENTRNLVLAVVVVEEDSGKKMWLWRLWWWFSCWKENQKRKVKRDNWIVEKKRGTGVSWKFGLLLERASWSSNSSICTICSPRIREPELEKIVGQWKQQEIELDTYSVISCQRGASAYYFDSMYQQMRKALFWLVPKHQYTALTTYFCLYLL